MMPLLTKKERHRSWEAEGRSPGIRCPLLAGILPSGPPTTWAFTPWGSYGVSPTGQMPCMEEAVSTEPSRGTAIPALLWPAASSPFAYSKATLKAWIAHTV